MVSTIAESLDLLIATKAGIKDAIEDKGVTVGDVPFSQYPAKIEEISGGGGGGGWQRPPDWLPLPPVAEGEQGVNILCAVFNGDANFVAFTVSGDYDVDWGDGSPVSHVSAGSTAYHRYVFDDLEPDTVTVQGYRQAIISITPQTGQNLTSINLNVIHNQTGLTDSYSTLYLDLEMRAPLCTSFTFGGGPTVQGMIERFSWQGPILITNGGQLFRYCLSLQEIAPGTDLSAITNAAQMFYNCNSLETLPDGFVLPNCTSCPQMFINCSSLQTLPDGLTFPDSTDTALMFYDCICLQMLPDGMSFESSTGTSQMFQTCKSIQRLNIVPPEVSFSVANCRLSADALDELFTNLAEVDDATITVTGNFGTGACDTSIATDKGWTVVTA